MQGAKNPEKKKKTVYKLYALRTTNDAINAAGNFDFARITGEYTLIYEKNEKIIHDLLPSIVYTIIGEHEIGWLSDQDRQWLNDCSLTIIADEALKNKELVLQRMEDTLTKLESELEKNRGTIIDGAKKGAGE